MIHNFDKKYAFLILRNFHFSKFNFQCMIRLVLEHARIMRCTNLDYQFRGGGDKFHFENQMF